jgi:hypothetical protein
MLTIITNRTITFSSNNIKQAIKDNGAFDRGFQYYRHDALESLEVKHKV